MAQMHRSSSIRSIDSDASTASNFSGRFSVSGGSTDSRAEKYNVDWIDKKQVHSCWCCSKKFSIVRTKHHCRKCGHVVCGSCSKSREILTQSKNKKRICDTCIKYKYEPFHQQGKDHEPDLASLKYSDTENQPEKQGAGQSNSLSTVLEQPELSNSIDANNKKMDFTMLHEVEADLSTDESVEAIEADQTTDEKHASPFVDEIQVDTTSPEEHSHAVVASTEKEYISKDILEEEGGKGNEGAKDISFEQPQRLAHIYGSILSPSTNQTEAMSMDMFVEEEEPTAIKQSMNPIESSLIPPNEICIENTTGTEVDSAIKNSFEEEVVEDNDVYVTVMEEEPTGIKQSMNPNEASPNAPDEICIENTTTTDVELATENSFEELVPEDTDECVTVVVPPGPLGILIDSSQPQHAVVQGFTPISGGTEIGAIEASLKVVPGCIMVAINQLDVSEKCLAEIAQLLVQTKHKTRVFKFRLPLPVVESVPDHPLVEQPPVNFPNLSLASIILVQKIVRGKIKRRQYKELLLDHPKFLGVREGDYFDDDGVLRRRSSVASVPTVSSETSWFYSFSRSCKKRKSVKSEIEIPEIRRPVEESASL